MDTDKMQVKRSLNYKQVLLPDDDHDDDKKEDIRLPGFRFHPTDEELVDFYLRRKVDKKLLNIDDLIKQIDIYKYDPWDLPQGSDAGDNEWYYFCRRGKKYRNSVRPNRVTGSGFWKATGIDRPIYSSVGSVCIGLKKSLVYYRGSAGKGTKTEWMMHEFRLPPSSDADINTKSIKNMDEKSLSQEAEVWTLCRILKRSMSHRKTLPDWKEVSAKRNPVVDTSSKTCSEEYDHHMQSYISFQAPIIQLNHTKNPSHNHPQQHHNHFTNGMNPLNSIGCFTENLASSDQAPSATASSSSFSDLDMNEFIKHGDWDDLRSVVEFAASDGRVFFR